MDFDLAQVAKEAGVKRPVVELRPIEPRIGTEDDYLRILRAMLAETATFVRNGIIPAADNERQFMVIRDAAGDRLGQMFAALRRLMERKSLTLQLNDIRLTGSSGSGRRSGLTLEPPFRAMI
jgi:hypothetical protein